MVLEYKKHKYVILVGYNDEDSMRAEEGGDIFIYAKDIDSLQQMLKRNILPKRRRGRRNDNSNSK